MGIPDHLTCPLRNLYTDKEATGRIGHRTTDWFQIRKGVCQGCILSLWLFNLYAEYIMQNARLDEAQLESRLPGEISITSHMQMTPPLWQKVKRNSKAFSNTTVQKHRFFGAQLSFQISHPYMTTQNTIALTSQTFVGKVMSLLFNMLSRLVKDCIPMSKHLLISWLQSPSAVILEPQKIKSTTVSTVSPSICHEVMGPDAMILVF